MHGKWTQYRVTCRLQDYENYGGKESTDEHDDNDELEAVG